MADSKTLKGFILNLFGNHLHFLLLFRRIKKYFLQPETGWFKSSEYRRFWLLYTRTKYLTTFKSFGIFLLC